MPVHRLNGVVPTNLAKEFGSTLLHHLFVRVVFFLHPHSLLVFPVLSHHWRGAWADLGCLLLGVFTKHDAP